MSRAPLPLLVRSLLTAALLAMAAAAEAQVIVPNLIYTTVRPCRVFDTRFSTGGKLMAGTPQTFNIVGNTTGTYFTNQGGPSGGCAVPGFAFSAPQVQAVAINLTVVGPSATGFINALPTDLASSGTSAVNVTAGSPAIANMVILAVRQDSQGGDIRISLSNGAADAFGDVVGYFSAGSVTPTGGTGNVLLGAGAGNQESSAATGGDNTAFGDSALGALTTGFSNAAVGYQSLLSATSGVSNTAFGETAAKTLTSGDGNTALGGAALFNLETGSENIAIGYQAGLSLLTSESNNIDIGSSGVVNDSGVIRLGSSQTAAFIAGIYGSTAASGSAVYVNSSGQLGTAPSSLRFKQDVQDMGTASAGLMQLRPVTFHYKPGSDDGFQLLQYGLVAEEVAKVYPGLVQLDQDGKPYSVRYQFVNAMLLNEVQAQHRKMAEQETLLAQQQSQLAALEARVAELQRILHALNRPGS